MLFRGGNNRAGNGKLDQARQLCPQLSMSSEDLKVRYKQWANPTNLLALNHWTEPLLVNVLPWMYILCAECLLPARNARGWPNGVRRGISFPRIAVIPGRTD
jgi:hypothetical protein